MVIDERPEWSIMYSYMTLSERLGGEAVVLIDRGLSTMLGFMQAGQTKAGADQLLKFSTSLARSAVALPGGNALVAASVGPYGAYLADGSEYSGRYGLSRPQLADFHARRLAVLLESGPDLVACETIPCVLEAAAPADVLTGGQGGPVVGCQPMRRRRWVGESGSMRMPSMWMAM
jgi:hypothetical protein